MSPGNDRHKNERLTSHYWVIHSTKKEQLCEENLEKEWFYAADKRRGSVHAISDVYVKNPLKRKEFNLAFCIAKT